MTQKVGLIGWPVEHSVSPAMHNAAFHALGLDWRYDPLPIMPGEVKRRIDTLIESGYCGFNVTVPHKQAVLALDIAESDKAVRAMGAANTLTVLENGRLRAANTDWHGFLADLQAHDVDVRGMDALILGTGGSSRAVDYALRQGRAKTITHVSRNKQGADHVIGYGDLAEFVRSTSPMLVINCTPVGMWPNIEPSVWPEDVPFPRHAILYDLIYNPPATRLMQTAMDVGAQVIGGLGMLVRQGALSFEQWTGIKPPLDVMESAARQRLGLAQNQ